MGPSYVNLAVEYGKNNSYNLKQLLEAWWGLNRSTVPFLTIMNLKASTLPKGLSSEWGALWGSVGLAPAP